jgi:hypothetical protein
MPYVIYLMSDQRNSGAILHPERIGVRILIDLFEDAATGPLQGGGGAVGDLVAITQIQPILAGEGLSMLVDVHLFLTSCRISLLSMPDDA